MTEACHSRLFAFVQGRLEQKDEPLHDKLGDDTSLLRAGHFDSLDLVELAGWIEQECGATQDLSALDPLEAWDTIRKILAYVDRQRAENSN
jgi:acyl carrier protein